MEWFRHLSAAIDYIEDNLDRDISYDKVAEKACCSKYYFQRLFSYVAGVSLSEYICRRKMTQAGFDLQTTDIKVLDVALKYGYSSPASFNRAFQRVHGMPPTAAKNPGSILNSYPPISFSIKVTGGTTMPYRVEKKEKMRIVGIRIGLTEEMDRNLKIVPEFWESVLKSRDFHIIESIRNRTYQPKPAKRKYIPKKNGKMRPLGITSTDDRLVQEVVRMILEAIYEPTFSDYSHGFRPKRSCHTALLQVKRMFTGVTWVVEGDIHTCFDNFDHHVLVELLRKRITDEAFISLIWKFLKAGYMEQWEYNCTYSGVPQGSGISPICANIYLSELDGFMQEYKEKYDCEPERRKTTKEYERASRRYKKARKALVDAEKPTPELVREFKDSRMEKMNQHYYNPFEEGYKKIQYNRYADDFVIGVIGPKRDAEKIKEDVRIFLKERLHLEMSEEKTEITHASKPVRYLGYDFKVMRSKSMKRCKNGDMKRVWNGKVFLYVPKEKWVKKAMEHGEIQVKRNKGTGKETWRPMPRKDLMNRNDADIVSTFNSEIRGLYNFYRIAENVGALHKYYYMVRYSMLKTLAGKHRTKVSAVKKRFMADKVLRIPYDTTKGRKYCEFYHDGFKKHSDGYDNVSDVMPNYKKYDSRHTIINRIKAGKCEICGEQAEYLCMHHVRTLKSLKGRDIFEKKMLEIRRKSLALCPDCFELLHETRESR